MHHDKTNTFIYNAEYLKYSFQCIDRFKMYRSVFNLGFKTNMCLRIKTKIFFLIINDLQ